jgi:NADH-quinone oxidoreductase subunit J
VADEQHGTGYDLPPEAARRGPAFESVLGLALLLVSTLFIGQQMLTKVLLPSVGEFAPLVGAYVRPSQLVFFALAGLTVGSAAGVAFSRNIIYSSVALLGTFLGVAGLYIYLSADFLAVTQVLIYIGGVLVLILFAVMLTSKIQDINLSNDTIGIPPAVVGAGIMAILLCFVAVETPWHAPATPEYRSTVAELGALFLNQYLLPFEIGSVVLLAALVGAVAIARRESKSG